MSNEPVLTRDPWAMLAARTPARIGLGRAGASLPTREVLRFALAHARARDAVWASLDPDGLARALSDALAEGGGPGDGSQPAILSVASASNSRSGYLLDPASGRRLSVAGRDLIAAQSGKPADVAIVVADGLSATAVMAHAPATVAALVRHLRASGFGLAPLVIATGARVALGDDIGQALGVGIVVMLIGERPGLSAPDSLGAYVTHAPRPGRMDAERNCVSNIRAEGLPPVLAAERIGWLVREALRRGLSGTGLRDESGAGAVDSPRMPELPKR